MVVNLLYAFLWQEEFLVDNPTFLDPDANALGNAYLPTVNDFANNLNNFPQYDMDLQVCNNIVSFTVSIDINILLFPTWNQHLSCQPTL